MRFSLALKNKYGQGHSLFMDLKDLHEYWYKIKGLEKKFMGRAEDFKHRYVGEFYPLAAKVTKEILGAFERWIEFHEYHTWWENMKEWGIQEDGVIPFSFGDLDIRPCVKKRLEEQLRESPDDPPIDLEEIYGDNWWKYTEVSEAEADKCKYYAWEQWKQFFPEYEKTTRIVRAQAEKLRSIIDSNDIDNVMSVISMSLNIAHNTGQMYEHMDLTKEQLAMLSNLGTSKWDTELARFAKKFLWSIGFRKAKN